MEISDLGSKAVQDVQGAAFPKVGEWTPKLVREHLPDVQVQTGKKTTETAVVRGRWLKFPHVYTPDGHLREYSWEAVARSLNNGQPLAGE